MAIDAKVSFIEQMEKGLAGVLTVEQMTSVRRLALGILDHFEMTEMQMLDLPEELVEKIEEELEENK